MTSLAELINKSKLNQGTLTLNHASVATLGRSGVFAHIVCLHLTGNLLTTLHGIEQFAFLRTLSISHNRITSVNELYRVVNPSILQMLSCSHNPFSVNPMHVTLILEKFTNLTQLDGTKLNFPKKLYFNWIERNEALLVPAYHALSDTVSPSTHQVAKQLKQLTRQYEPSIEEINQLFQLLLEGLPQTECDHYEVSQHLLWDILHYQQSSKSPSLKNFLVQASLENHDVNLFLFAQNNDYARHAITSTFMNLAHTKNGFSYFPLDRSYLLAVIATFLNRIKAPIKQKQIVPDLLIVPLEYKPKQLPILHPPSQELTQPMQAPSSSTYQQPIQEQQVIANPKTKTHTKRSPSFVMLERKIMGNIAFGWRRLLQQVHTKRSQHQYANLLMNRLNACIETHSLNMKQQLMAQLKRSMRICNASTKLTKFLNGASLIDKSNIFQSLLEEQYPNKREQLLRVMAFHGLKKWRLQKTKALECLSTVANTFASRIAHQYYLRWKIFATRAQFESNKTLARVVTRYRDSGTTLPKRSALSLETTRYPITTREDASISIKQATINCDQLTIVQKKKKKKKKQRSKKKKVPKTGCCCSHQQMYCDVCRSFYLKQKR